MQKVKITQWVIAGLLFFCLLAYGAYKRNSKFILGTKSTNTKEETKPSQTPKSDNNLYIDSSGFSFEYPKGYKILDITPADNTYYSVVEVLKDSTPSAISKQIEKEATMSALIIATDSSIPKIVVTIKDGTYKKPIGSKEIDANKEIGKVKATLYFFKDKGDEMVSLAAENNGILYLIESPKKEEWENILNLIAKTFTLGVFPTPTPTLTPP